jgi:GH25 family lysozyme M1 (1,4-beta-N-acetylmuramidase)
LRCLSKRSDGEQCSRRKKEGCDFCGTHSKGSPHGNFVQDNVIMKKVEVWAQEIGGIIYYIDNEMNVYKTEDIINNKTNPAIVAKYQKNGEIYSILDFEL